MRSRTGNCAAAWLSAALVLGMAAASAGGQAPVRVTGRLMDANGHTEVPRGLFGVHAMKLTPEVVADWGIECFRQIHFGPGSGSVAIGKDGQRVAPFKDMPVVIDCQGDRYCPAPVLTNPQYAEFFSRIGREYAQKCKDLAWHGYAEFWNEPYLNWADRSRKNYDRKFYDVAKAADDGPVTIKGWDKPLEHLRWRRLWAKDESGKIAFLVPLPKGAKAGDTFRHQQTLYFTDNREQTYTVVEEWNVYDPTQVSFWSGKQNYQFYMWMFLPWAKAIRETNPQVTILAGWDFAVLSDDWKAWEILYKPMLDEGIPWIDGVTEHHYGLNSRANTATYEVVVGYAMAEHGKWLHMYNTETSGSEDPSVPGARHGTATPYGVFNYGLRDIVELCSRSPDKAASRTSHAPTQPGWGGGGDEFLFKLLKDLRGKLVQTACADPDLWPVASLNGDRLVVVLFNDHAEEHTAALAVAAPAGTRLAGGRKVWVRATAESGPLEFREEPVAAQGDRTECTLKMPGKSGVKLVFALQGKPPERPQVLRRQFFAKGVVNKVERGKPVALAVRVDPAILAKAEAAWLRLVLEGVKGGEAGTRVNGTAVALPDREWLTDVPVDVRLLKEQNALVFESTGDGYRMDVASLVLDAPL